ncbi:MAG: zinc ABC transporter substrate-binding protein [Acidimicrobiales bacterium]|nr:zinc ABC transporter substrate-binding protein [Acidimicrobiales bacterium]
MLRRHLRTSALIAAASALALVAAACGSDTSEDASSDSPTVVVTTSILGDVVANVVGDEATVEVLMPAGVDPHEFELSAAEAAQLQDADVIVANGLGFEAGMTDALDAAEEAGVPVIEVAPGLDPLPLAEGAHDHAHEEEGAHDEEAAHSEEEAAHSEEEAAHDEEAAHSEEEGEALDPHVFTDPARMADGVEQLATSLGEEVPALAGDVVAEQAATYADEVRAADQAIEEELSAIPADQRVLVTNHEVFAYFADRYDFEVIGTVIPGGTTLAETSSQELTDLAAVIEENEVPAIFADASSPTELADALAEEGGLDVEVVALYSESLGEPGSDAETYLDMITSNSAAITAALSGTS